MLTSFWQWYERNYRLNITIVVVLFVLQLVHLYWLSVDVVLVRLTGIHGLWPDWQWLEFIITVVDYTEIPALLTTSLVYINEFRQGRRARAVMYLVLLNSQWLHLFWITDEFVVDQFTGVDRGTILPVWLAWVAIAIDYLEVPVIIDLIRKLARDLKKGDLKAAVADLKEH
jgi:hypothetical protein